MSKKVGVIIKKDENGYYAYSPEIDGCQSQGETLEEVIGNIREAVELYLETLTKAEKKALLSREIFTTSLEVKVALAATSDGSGKRSFCGVTVLSV